MHPPAAPPHPPVAGASIGVRCRRSTPLRATESWPRAKIRIISIYISKIQIHRDFAPGPLLIRAWLCGMAFFAARAVTPQQWFCSPMGNPKKPMGRQSSWETSGSWELGTWRFLGGNWEARVRVRVRESWEAKKMTKKTRGIEPCLAYESWSSLEESASPLQHSLKPACKILAI
jgi:hypothetical protein